MMLDLAAETDKLFIGGRFQPSASSELFDSVNPATGQVIARLPEANPADLQKAIEAAKEAQVEWRTLPWQRRSRTMSHLADALEQRAETFARIDVADSGNPIVAMRNDVTGGLQEFRYYAGLAPEAKGTSQPSVPSELTFSERTPYGIVGRLVPFNHPFKAAIGKIGAPLAAGNAVILKPSEHTSLSALKIAAVAADILPAGLLTVLTGHGKGVGATLVGHPDVPRISFTGSVQSGRAVLRAAADYVKHVTVELGGKNPFILFPDADVRHAARAAVTGMNLARSSGQSCQSTSRIYAHSQVRQAFTDALLKIVRDLKVGDPSDETTDLGPLSFRSHFEHVRSLIATGRAEGATLLHGGGFPAGQTHGFYVEPTVFADVTDSMTIAREEIFGPVMSILEWTEIEDVVARANNTPYGLTANVWSSDVSRAVATARAVEAGYVFVNSSGKRPLGAPFGGWKSSGLGKGSSLEELMSYTREKSITIELGQ